MNDTTKPDNKDSKDNIQTIALRRMEPVLGFGTLCLSQFIVIQWAYFTFPYEDILMNQTALDNQSYFMATVFITTIISVTISMWFGRFMTRKYSSKVSDTLK